MKNNIKNKKGFTLIELLVVIAIIGLLSSIILANLSNARLKAQDAKTIAQTVELKKALALYYDDYGGYPTVTADADLADAGDIIGDLSNLDNYITLPLTDIDSNTVVYKDNTGNPSTYGLGVDLQTETLNCITTPETSTDTYIQIPGEASGSYYSQCNF